MFNIEKVNETIKKQFDNYYEKAEKEIRNELSSKGYDKIIEQLDVKYVNRDLKISIILKKDIQAQGVDIYELFARGGGLIDKEKNKINVLPSPIMIKYLSKR